MGSRKPWGYWGKWENRKKELEKEIKKFDGKVPSSGELDNNGRKDLVEATRIYDGGYSSAIAKLGYTPSSKKMKRRSKKEMIVWGNFERELKAVIDDLGHFPSERELRKIGDSIYHYYQYHGGVEAIKKRMGYKYKDKTREYWDVWENRKKELETFITELGRLPKYEEFRPMGKGSLLDAIENNEKSISKVFRKMGYTPQRSFDRKLKIWENLELELNKLIVQLNRFPEYKDFVELKKKYLYRACSSHHGGIEAVKERMGYGAGEYKYCGPLTIWENLKKELNKIIQEKGDFPEKPEFVKMNRFRVYQSFFYHGGVEAVKERMGYGEGQKLESLLEGYVEGMTESNGCIERGCNENGRKQET